MVQRAYGDDMCSEITRLVLLAHWKHTAVLFVGGCGTEWNVALCMLQPCRSQPGFCREES